jgi:hypothetical protein
MDAEYISCQGNCKVRHRYGKTKTGTHRPTRCSGSYGLLRATYRVERISLLVRFAQKNKMILQIQHELVEQGLSITETEAGASSKDVQALQDLREEYLQRLRRMAEQRKKN